MNPVGGHVRAGETELEALQREAQEEIGIQAFEHTFIGRAQLHRHVVGRDENHLFIVYEITTNDEIILGPEADSIVHLSTLQLQTALQETPTEFGDAYYFILEHFYQTYLPESYQFRWATA